MKVVIADDSVLIREQLIALLSTVKGLVISGVAENGIEAVRLVEDISPDLLVLDVLMPFKDGLETLEEIRRGKYHTVIVIHTADPSPQLREACFEAGADFFISKGDFNRLVEICQVFISQRR